MSGQDGGMAVREHQNMFIREQLLLTYGQGATQGGYVEYGEISNQTSYNDSACHWRTVSESNTRCIMLRRKKISPWIYVVHALTAELSVRAFERHTQCG